MVRPKAVGGLFKETFQAWYADNTFQLGAALAYYSVFSLAPILVIAIAVASLFFGEEAARGGIAEAIADTVGPRVADAIQETLKQTAQTHSSGFATMMSLALLLFGASALFSQLQQSLNIVWGVKARPGRGWLNMIKDRFWSFAIVLGVGFLLLVSLVIDTSLSVVATLLHPSTLPGGVYLWAGLHWMISLGFVTVLFAMIYKLLPDVKLTWRDVWVGSVVTAIFFVIGEHLIGYYLASSSWISAYGAAGSLVVLLLWVFYSSQAFLLGAEFTQVYARRLGRPLVPEDCAEPLTADDRARQGMQPIQRFTPK